MSARSFWFMLALAAVLIVAGVVFVVIDLVSLIRSASTVG